MRRSIVILWSAASMVALAGAIAPSPQVASGGINADRVDGFHAIRSSATNAQRRGKLVATSTSGYLPDDIIRKAPDADMLDGIDSKSFLRAGSLAVQNKVYRTQVPAGRQTVTVTCPAGWTATGGGVGMADASPRATVIGSKPVDPNGWQVEVIATGTTTVESWVVCVDFG